jgi:hypothetical protein
MAEPVDLIVVHDVYGPRVELAHLYRDHPDMSSNKILAAELTFYSGGDEPMAVTLDEASARALAAALLAGFTPRVNLGPSHAGRERPTPNTSLDVRDD